MQSSLFDQVPLSGWLPDETLYSWCSRFHLVSCNHLPGATTKALFGHRYLGSAHDFPCRIDQFVARTHGDLGPASSIISKHTILPIFMPFQSPMVAQLALEKVRGPNVGALKYRLGLLTSHFRAHFPLKACAECVAQDRRRYGIAYWHRSHQFPGAWVCTQHDGKMLLESTLKSTGAQRFDWILPEDLHFRPVAFKPSHTALHQLLRLATATNDLSGIKIGWHFDPKAFSETMLARLRQKGLASSTLRLKAHDIGSEFQVFMSSLHGLEEFQTITGSEVNTAAQANAYFHRLHRITHPLRHLLMITWLYPEWSTFFEDYQARVNGYRCAESGVSAGESVIAAPGPPIDFELRDACVRLSTNEQLTATAIGNRLNVTVATVMAHLAAAGISTPKRPKVLRGKKQDELVTALRTGLSKQEAAEKTGVSIGTVTRFLLSEVGLHQEWVQIRYELNRQKMRLQWNALISGNLTVTQKLLRSIEPNTYSWLYRNDREWLRSASQGRFLRPTAGGRTVDWEDRDQKMVSVVQIAIRDLLNNLPSKHIHLTDLISLAPQLKPFVNKLDSLPRTQLLLQQFMRNQSRNNPDLFGLT